MPRHFNIAGPCNPDIHYMISPLARIPKVMDLIEQQAYFVIHAPRQIGKTTAMMALAQALTNSGRYVGVLVSVEEADAFPNDIGAAEATILRSWYENATDRLPPRTRPHPSRPRRTRSRHPVGPTQLGQNRSPPLSHLRAFGLSQGQPWLVNAIAKVVVEDLATDRSIAITPEHIDRAKEILIQRMDTHLDSLVERLKEDRVRHVIEPILSGGTFDNIPEDDRRFVLDLGLVKRSSMGGLEIANPIYKEVLPRVLSSNTQDSLPSIQPTWLTPRGELDINALLEAFLDFWRQHGQPLLKSVSYHEIAPHIVLMAFLHRVANGGGQLEREYAIGTRRMDICLRYKSVTVGMELKVWRDNEKDPMDKALVQLDRYLAGLGLDQGWLVIFDQRSGLPPIEDRTTTEMQTSATGRSITVIRG